MSRRIPRWPFLFALVLAVPLVSPKSHAQAKDATASKLIDDAMNADYLGMKFADAEKKLRKALTTCGQSGCSPTVKAKAHRSLGIVLVAGLNKAGEGQAAFAESIRLDPNASVDKDFITPDIEKAWQAAKSGGGGDGGSEAAGAASGEEPAGAADKPAAGAAGELNHVPVAEQMNLTPVPVYVEVPRSLSPSRIMVRYRPAGMSEWKKIEASRIAKGYGAEIPCADVGSATGDLSYYIEALDANGEILATSGSRTKPHRVPIKNELSAEPPHLPGRPPSARCQDKADCPPGLPGCGKKVGGKGWGSSCESDGECAEGLSCKKGSCESGSGGGPTKCDTDIDCEVGQTCNEHMCEGQGEGLPKKNWLSLSVQQDFSLLGTDQKICSEGHSGLYACWSSIDGYEYHGTPSDEEGEGNRIESGGFRLANTRILLGYDRLITENISVGVRAGYAFNSAPEAIAIHGELRGLYWFGQRPFASATKIRPFAGLIGGMAEVDVKLKVPVRETMGTNSNSPTEGAQYAKDFNSGDPTTWSNFGAYLDPDSSTGDQTLNVWRRSRAAFAGVTGGAMIPIAGGKQGITAEIKLMVLFPFSGISVSPTVGYAIGF